MIGLNRNELEQEIKYRLEHADHDGAATMALRGYGPEIFGFLHVFHRNPQDAAEVLAIFSERLWRDLPTFRGDCTFRTWACAAARHSALNYARDSRRRRGREEGLPEGSELSARLRKRFELLKNRLREQLRSSE